MRLPSTPGQIAASFAIALVGLVLLFVTSRAGGIMLVGDWLWRRGPMAAEAVIVEPAMGLGFGDDDHSQRVGAGRR
jgi:hypothetical protein